MINRVIKLFIKTGVVIFVILITIATALYLGYITRDSFWKEFDKKKETSSTIYFSDITDFEWKFVCILPPYSVYGEKTDNETLSRYVSVNRGDVIAEIPNLSDDGEWGFAFINDSKIVKIYEKSIWTRGWFFVENESVKNCFDKNKAAFVISGHKVEIKEVDR